MNPPAPKRLKLSASIPDETNESTANGTSQQFDNEASEMAMSPSITPLETPTQTTSSHTSHSITPPKSLESLDALWQRWAVKLNQIQQKEPTRGSGSFKATEYAELYRVLKRSHPNLSIEQDNERKELLKLVGFKMRHQNFGALGWADLSSLRLIFLASLVPEGSIIEDLEDEACLVDLEAIARRPFSLTAVRRLKRVFERTIPNFQHSQWYQEIQSALEETEVKRNPLGHQVLKKCLELLFPTQCAAQSTPSGAIKSPGRPKKRDSAEGADHRGKASKAVDCTAPAPSSVRSPSTASTPPRKQHTATSTPRSLMSSKASLLDNEASTQLLGVYFNVHHPVLPIFAGDALKAAYREVRSMGDGASAYDTAITYICLSLSSLADTWSKTPGAPAATDLYNYGQSYLPSIQKNDSTLHLIQCHILQAQYQFQIGDLNEASATVSSAVSRAHSEGMHTKRGAYHQVTGEELQLRRRIWHAIQILERSLALYRGLEPPNFCSDCDAPFPEDDTASQQSEPPNGSQPNELRSLGLQPFNAWARLYQGVDDLMEIERDFRIHDGGCQMHKIECDFDAYNKAHKRLARWKRSLSQSLAITDNASQSATRLCRIIQLRYLYLQLRLHRPLLILAIALSFKCADCAIDQSHLRGPSLEAPLEFALIQQGFAKCLKAAIELCSLLNTMSTDPLLNAYLTEFTEFAYACGLVLVAACMVPRLVGAAGMGLTQSRCDMLSASAITLLKKCEVMARRNNELNARISRSKDALVSLSKTAGRDTDPQYVFEHVKIPSKAWDKIYGRLRLDFPGTESASSPADAPSPFAWIESQPMDFDD